MATLKLTEDEKKLAVDLDSNSIATETAALLFLQHRVISGTVNTIDLDQYVEAFLDLEYQVRQVIDALNK